jgi:hypothetical protein
MAVGPFDPLELCVTGGATVAIDDRCSRERAWRQTAALENDGVDGLQGSFVMDLRRDITMTCVRNERRNDMAAVLEDRLTHREVVRFTYT